MKGSLIIIPTYNELENIIRMVPEIFSLSPDIHLLIVDDASPDGTADAIKNIQPTFQGRLHLLERNSKQGLGTAYIEGFRWALHRSYEFIFEMDADFSHSPKDIQRLYLACADENFDVAIGSRYIRGGQVKNWPLSRILMSYFASVYVRLITWMPIADTTAGFVCYKRKVLEAIDLSKINFIGYAFQIEMKFAAWKTGCRVKEVPICFEDRKEGTSKMSKGIFKEAALGVWSIKWKSFFQSYRKK